MAADEKQRAAGSNPESRMREEMVVNILSSADGTKIAYDKQDDGRPALILVDGAMCSRSSGSQPELASRGCRGADRGRGRAGLPVRALLGSVPGPGSGGARRPGQQARHV